MKRHWFLIFNQTRIDVTLITEKGKVTAFSVNLSILKDEEKHDVIRWDTAHGFLHKHEFWTTKKAIRVRRYENIPLDVVFREVYDDLKNNWKKYVERWKDAQKNN